MRRKSFRGGAVGITHLHEFEIAMSASVVPFSRAVLNPPEKAHPDEGGEVEDVRVVLSAAQLQRIRATWDHRLKTYLDASLEDFALAFLRALDPSFAKQPEIDEEFWDALDHEACDEE